MKRKLSAKHIMALIAVCGLTGASVGICTNTAAVFYNPVAEDLGTTRAAIAMTMTLASLAGSVMGLFVPKILKNPKNMKKLIYAAAVLLLGGTFMLSKCTNVYMLYVFNILRGFGSGMCNFMLATIVINNWFFANHGTFVSAVLCFSGIPGAVFSNLFSGFITTYGWRTAYIIVAGFMLVFLLPALVLPFTLTPAESGLKPYGYEDYETVKNTAPEKMILQDVKVPNEGLKLAMLLIFTVMVSVVAGIMQQMPSFAVSIGYTAALGATMLAVINVANIVSKLLFGILSDRIGTRNTAVAYAIISGTALLLLPVIKVIPVILVLCFMYGMTMANSSSAMSLATSDIFGMASYNRLYPIVMLTGSVCFAVGVTLIGLFVDFTGSFSMLMWLGAGMQAVAVLSFIILYAMNTRTTA